MENEHELTIDATRMLEELIVESLLYSILLEKIDLLVIDCVNGYSSIEFNVTRAWESEVIRDRMEILTMDKFSDVIAPLGLSLEKTNEEKTYKLDMIFPKINYSNIREALKPFAHGFTRTQLQDISLSLLSVNYYAVAGLLEDDAVNVIFKGTLNAPVYLLSPLVDKIEEMFGVELFAEDSREFFQVTIRKKKA